MFEFLGLWSRFDKMRVLMFPGKVSRTDNPYITILVDGLARNGVSVGGFRAMLNPTMDVLHIHWLEGVCWGRLAHLWSFWARLRASLLVTVAKTMRRENKPVVWTVHNLEPHDLRNEKLQAVFVNVREQLLPLVTDIICMSDVVGRRVLDQHPNLKSVRMHKVPHPNYVGFFAKWKKAIPAQIRNFVAINKDVPTLGALGFIRPYKGIPSLIAALKSSSLSFQLVVAGTGPKREVDRIKEAIDGDKRFLLYHRNLTHSEYLGVMSVIDVAVFNFENILNSGSVLAALSLHVPVLAPDKGAIVDLKNFVSAPWLSTFRDTDFEDTLATVLASVGARREKLDLAFCEPTLVGHQLKLIYRNGN